MLSVSNIKFCMLRCLLYQQSFKTIKDITLTVKIAVESSVEFNGCNK